MAAKRTDELIYEILSVVEEIPEGRVTTYGNIAKMIGRDRNSRLVGNVLSMSEYYGEYPCHRVVNHAGRLAPHFPEQRRLLAMEGVVFRDEQHVKLKDCLWQPHSDCQDDERRFTYHYDSPFGGITLASDGDALIGLWFDGQKYFGDTLSDKHEERALPVFDETIKWLDIYFSGRDPGFTPKIKMLATSFRKRVWEIMLSIPFGRTMTYLEIARQIAGERGLESMSAQAVGGAVGHNSISLIIPCHRVVGTNGSLTGYAGGIDVKAGLLRMENADMKGKGIL